MIKRATRPIYANTVLKPTHFTIYQLSHKTAEISTKYKVRLRQEKDCKAYFGIAHQTQTDVI